MPVNQSIENNVRTYRLTSRHPTGIFNAGIDLPPVSSLEETETSLEGAERQLFLQFMGKMMRWLPEQRCTPGQLLNDPWLKSQLE